MPREKKPERASKTITEDLRRAVAERDKAAEKEAARARQLDDAQGRHKAAKNTVRRLKGELDEAMGAGR